jgi:hypothetical protein
MSILSVANVWFESTGANRMDLIASNNLIRITGAGGVVIPSGNTGSRPTANLAGTIRFNTDLGTFENWDTVLTRWRPMYGATGGTDGNRMFFENQSNVTSDYTITTGFNAGTFGPITLNAGISVTIPSNSVWTVV